MKHRKMLACLFVVALTLIFSSSAYPYGYGTAGEDSLITMFKSIIVEAKKPTKDWGALNEIITVNKQPISNLGDFFKLDIYAKFKKGLKEKDLKSIINNTVNLVYLSMMEKFELIKQNEFKDYNFAKGRLALNDKYYREIFKGNVIKYDKKNGTKINDETLKALQDIPGTIGKPSKFGMGGEPPHPDDYEALYKKIKDNLKTVFPYFEG